MNIKLVQESFKQVDISLATMFYDELIKRKPVIKFLFKKTTRERQDHALFLSLSFIINSLDKPHVVLPYLEKLGERHIKYQVKPEHYDLGGQILIYVLSKSLKTQWNSELEKEWTSAWILIANNMQKKYPPPKNPWWYKFIKK